MDEEIINIVTSKLSSLSNSLSEINSRLQDIIIDIKTLNHSIQHHKKLDDFFDKSLEMNQDIDIDDTIDQEL